MAVDVDKSNMMSFRPIEENTRMLLSVAPKRTADNFPLPTTGVRIAASNGVSVAEKTWICSVDATSTLVDDGDH